MNDREELGLAAEACGIEVTGYVPELGLQYINGSEESPFTDFWNPLTDDGDALRLAVKLGILEVAEVLAFWIRQDFQSGDPYAATRRAIVRAAAEIGKGME